MGYRKGLTVKQIAKVVTEQLPYPLVISIESGVTTHKKQAYSFNFLGKEITRGLPDMVLMSNEGVLFLEIKRKNDYISTIQKVVFSMLYSLGFKVIVASETNEDIAINEFTPLRCTGNELLRMYMDCK